MRAGWHRAWGAPSGTDRPEMDTSRPRKASEAGPDEPVRVASSLLMVVLYGLGHQAAALLDPSPELTEIE